MRSDRALAALNDILRHIDLARGFVDGLELNTFEADIRTVYAVTRCLEVISEASRRLPDDLKQRHPSLAWTQMAAAGNIYRHVYEDVAPALIWETVKQALPSLRDVVCNEITRLQGTSHP